MPLRNLPLLKTPDPVVLLTPFCCVGPLTPRLGGPHGLNRGSEQGTQRGPKPLTHVLHCLLQYDLDSRVGYRLSHIHPARLDTFLVNDDR
jgi:hypothetical protein